MHEVSVQTKIGVQTKWSIIPGFDELDSDERNKACNNLLHLKIRQSI
jgi:hypothetical protein